MLRPVLMAVISVLAVSIGPAMAPAQPTPPAAAPAPPPTAREVLAAIAARYRAGPVCERVGIEVRPGSGRAARSSLIVRLDPRAPAGEGGEGPGPEPAAVIELGSVRLAAARGRLVATHTRNPAIYFEAPLVRPLTAAAIGAVLPPIPLPQLDLMNWGAAQGGDGPSELAAYARNIRWSSATPDPRGPDRVTVEGVCDGGAVSVIARSGRLQSVEIRLDSPETTIRMSFTPVLPCLAMDSATSPPGAEGRTRVLTLAELQPRPGTLRVGSAVPEMPLSAAAGQPQRVQDLYTLPAEFQPAPSAERLVLLIARQQHAAGDGTERRLEGVRTAEFANELRRLQREGLSGPAPSAPDREPRTPLPAMAWAQVIVWERPPPAEVLLATLKSERDAWGDGLLWTTQPSATVDLFAAPGESVVVVLDPGRRLVAAVPITGQTTTEGLIDQVTLALMEETREP